MATNDPTYEFFAANAGSAVPSTETPSKEDQTLKFFESGATPIKSQAIGLPQQPPGELESLGAGAGTAFGKGVLAVQQIIGKGLSNAGDLVGSENVTNAGKWLNDDAVKGALKLESENKQYAEANPKTNIGGQIAGIVANPINKIIPGGGASSYTGAALQGAWKGAALNALTSPVTEGGFLQGKLQQGALGAIGGGIGGTLAHGLGSLISKAIDKFKSATGGLLSGDTSTAAAQTVKDTLDNIGVKPETVDPDALAGLHSIVKKALDTGNKPDPEALARLAKAQSLPIPVPMTTGQITRDPMQFAMEQNLRGIKGVGEPISGIQEVGEPITRLLQKQNKALLGNLDAMGATNGTDIISAGKVALDSLKNIDDKARQAVSDSYDAYKNSTGRSLDVPLSGIAQDYARILDERGTSIPASVKSKFESLGLLSGKQQSTFSIDDAENLIKNYINKNYDPMNKPAAGALDELKASVQKAISTGAGQSAEGTAAASLAAEARNAARERFQFNEATPAMKDALNGVQPDKFIQKNILQGNVAEIRNMTNALTQNDPQALSTLQNSVLAHIKNEVINNATNENAIFSQAKLKNFVQNPQMSARLTEILGQNKMDQLKQLNEVAEHALYAPKASAVNTSNTASAAANIIKETIGNTPLNSLLTLAQSSKLPFVQPAARAMQQKAQNAAAAGLVNRAVSPTLTPAQAGTYLSSLPSLGSRAGAAYAETRTQKRAQR
jgi:hypothetical protein